MYNVAVPVINNTCEKFGRENMLKMFKDFDANRVFLAVDSYIFDENQRKNEIKMLAENCRYFKEHGFEVGVWIWTFMTGEDGRFVHMKSPTGKTEIGESCPSDPEFRSFAADYLKDLAKCGVDLIMFDDDFRYGFLGMGFGCVCDNHIAKIREILGEDASFEQISHGILYGGKNKYRDAFLEANGYFMRLFAKEMREAVDSVNENIRLGQCSCMSAWDFDGVSSYEISKILAGKTKPFMRLIGAPYWAAEKMYSRSRIQNVIEYERMELSWSKNRGIEIFGEGDVYPRPRQKCPASLLELFDIALRADGGIDGILKYGEDYGSGPLYETGYAALHIHHRPIYEQVQRAFSGKEAVGVRVYERMQKYADMVLPEEMEGKTDIQDMFYPQAARMLADNSVPSIYEGIGTAGIAFAENVSIVSEEAMKKGVIIDLKAARILKEKGIDTGLLSVGEGFTALREDFVDTGFGIDAGFTAYDIKVSPNAVIKSRFSSGKTGTYNWSSGEKIASYYYENANGQKFLVFAFNGYFNGEAIARSYARADEIISVIQNEFGSKLPAYSKGNPDLYIMAKTDGKSMAVGLWNAFADPILTPEVVLDKEYKNITFINCDGKIEGNKVVLQKMPAFSFAGFEVE